MRTACVVSAITLSTLSAASTLDAWAVPADAPFFPGAPVREALTITSPTALDQRDASERSPGDTALLMLCLDLDALLAPRSGADALLAPALSFVDSSPLER